MRAQIVEMLLNGLTDNSGDLLNAGKVYTYSAGTTTDKATYLDNLKASQAANPIVLDAYGRKQIYADGAYKFVVKTSADVTLYTLDNLFFGLTDGAVFNGGTSSGAANVFAITLSPAPSEYFDGMIVTFKAHQTNTSTPTINVNTLGSKNITFDNAQTYATTAGVIRSGNYYIAMYNASAAAFILLNPSEANSTWTPTLTPRGAMTYGSTSITFAEYYQQGRTVRYRVAFTGTVGGTPDYYVGFSLPVSSNGDNLSASVSVLDNGSLVAGHASLAAANQIALYRYDRAVFTAGTVSFWAQGFYEV